MSIAYVKREGPAGSSREVGVAIDYRNATILYYSDGTGRIEENQRRVRTRLKVVPQTFRHQLTLSSYYAVYWSQIRATHGSVMSYHAEGINRNFWTTVNPELEHPLADPVHGGIDFQLRRGTRAEMKRILTLAIATSDQSDRWVALGQRTDGPFKYVAIEAGDNEKGPHVDIASLIDPGEELTHLLQLIAAEYYPIGRGNWYSGSAKLSPMTESVPFVTRVRGDDIAHLTPREVMQARHELASWLRTVDLSPEGNIGKWQSFEKILDEPLPAPEAGEVPEVAGSREEERVS